MYQFLAPVVWGKAVIIGAHSRTRDRRRMTIGTNVGLSDLPQISHHQTDRNLLSSPTRASGLRRSWRWWSGYVFPHSDNVLESLMNDTGQAEILTESKLKSSESSSNSLRSSSYSSKISVISEIGRVLSWWCPGASKNVAGVSSSGTIESCDRRFAICVSIEKIGWAFPRENISTSPSRGVIGDNVAWTGCMSTYMMCVWSIAETRTTHHRDL
jgi:hypothetical protein